MSCLWPKRATRRGHVPEHDLSSLGLFAGCDQPIKNAATAAAAAATIVDPGDRAAFAVVEAAPSPVGVSAVWCGFLAVRRSAVQRRTRGQDITE